VVVADRRQHNLPGVLAHGLATPKGRGPRPQRALLPMRLRPPRHAGPLSGMRDGCENWNGLKARSRLLLSSISCSLSKSMRR
jgi:hypothetical protein